MGDRKKIALTYYYSENWIAGAYYVVNIIAALNKIEDKLKPKLYLIYNKQDGLDLIKNINYPYIQFVLDNPTVNNKAVRLLAKIGRRLFGPDFYIKFRLWNVKSIFEGAERFYWIKNHFYWVHDFQQCHLPEFFSKEEIESRSSLPAKVAKMKDATLILSSNDAKKDFEYFFPGFVCRVKVLRFASSLPDFSSVQLEEIQNKFDISKPYFLCSNQFWQHKNHWAILEALKILKEEGIYVQVVFTGKNYDYRNPEYFESIKAFIKEHNLDSYVRILGFIDREVQLCLGANALSYIQPSLFEGWSTTVEDVKNLNQFILLSDIPVHREQIQENVIFFNPREAYDLVDKMKEILKGKHIKIHSDYNKNVKEFGYNILSVFNLA
ncbi:glycosyltransferase [Flavihumibacter sediminis]|nr:glycosyltransferase [Flavihumibacter sediminis]